MTGAVWYATGYLYSRYTAAEHRPHPNLLTFPFGLRPSELYPPEEARELTHICDLGSAWGARTCTTHYRPSVGHKRPKGLAYPGTRVRALLSYKGGGAFI